MERVSVQNEKVDAAEEALIGGGQVPCDLRHPALGRVVAQHGVRNKRGDFEPLISEDLFYLAQAVLSGRVPSTAPRKRAHPDFPLRGFVRCEACGRGLTGSWSKPRNSVNDCQSFNADGVSQTRNPTLT
jgi:hypothetical protein